MTRWGPVIDHDGGPCPFPQGTPIRVLMGSGKAFEGTLHHPTGNGWNWNGPSDPETLSHVLAYQLPRPRAVRLVFDPLLEIAQVGAEMVPA